jgi:hypothetical protein
MTIPHYINEDRSEMRGIKPGWYAMDDAGKLSSGPFSSREECLSRGTQPKNESTPLELRPRPKLNKSLPTSPGVEGAPQDPTRNRPLKD